MRPAMAAVATTEPTEPAPPRARSGPRRVPVGAVAAALLVVAGLAVRVAVMRSGIGALDADEAVVGLMARQAAAGHFRAFYWGQTYGGTLEVGLVALAFRVFGESTAALKTVPLVLYGGAAALVWRIGRRVTGAVPAAVAGLLVWIWPANYLWWSVKARGFYEATLCLSLAVVLVGLRIGLDPGRPRWADWAALGVLGGLGWWQSPQVALAAVPVAAWLLWSLRQRAWRAVAALPGFALGSLPWWVANIGSGFASLTPPRSPVKGGYLSHLAVFAHESLPMTLGLRVVYGHRWVRPPAVSIAWLVLAVALVAAGCCRRWPGGRVVVLLLVAYPLLNALLTLSGTVAEGRYTLFLLPWIALCLAHGASGRWWAAALLLLAAAVVTSSGVGDLRGRTSPFFSGRQLPASLAPLERALAAHGTSRIWSTYWVAYRVTFETGGRVMGAPATADRYPAYTRLVATADPPAAHVFITGTHDDLAFRDGLLARRIPFRSYTAGGEWTVYQPAVPVGPFDIPGSGGA